MTAFGTGGGWIMETLCEWGRGKYVSGWEAKGGLYDCKILADHIYTKREHIMTGKLGRGEGGQWKHYVRGAREGMQVGRGGYVSDRTIV